MITKDYEWIWRCETHDVYFDALHDRTHEDCPTGSELPGGRLMYPLQPREVVYFLNEAIKTRKFVRSLRRFIDSGGMVTPEING